MQRALVSSDDWIDIALYALLGTAIAVCFVNPDVTAGVAKLNEFATGQMMSIVPAIYAVAAGAALGALLELRHSRPVHGWQLFLASRISACARSLMTAIAGLCLGSAGVYGAYHLQIEGAAFASLSLVYFAALAVGMLWLHSGFYVAVALAQREHRVLAWIVVGGMLVSLALLPFWSQMGAFTLAGFLVALLAWLLAALHSIGPSATPDSEP